MDGSRSVAEVFKKNLIFMKHPIAGTSKLADVAVMSARKKSLTIAFYAAFALWFTAMSYSGPGFYGSLIHPFVQDVFGIVLWGIFVAVVVVVARRSISVASIPWLDLVVFGCAVVALDLFWRLYLSPDAWDAFKVTSVVVDAATPIIGAIGVAALVGEWRRGRRLSA